MKGTYPKLTNNRIYLTPNRYLYYRRNNTLWMYFKCRNGYSNGPVGGDVQETFERIKEIAIFKKLNQL